MNVLIKEMEMPKGCYCCPLAHRNYNLKEDMTQLACYVADKWASDDGEKPDWCPLVEVPPHGDLIDRDVLLASFKESIDECHKWANEIPNETEMYARVSQALGTFVECSLRTKGMPTVIPADEEGET